MPIFVRDGRSVLFVHVPKTGGTSIERLFLRAGWEMHLRALRRTDPELFPLLRCAPQHYHAAMLDELLDLERLDLAFMVTRDPLARLRSEYVMRNSADLKVDEGSVERWTRRVLSEYQGDPFLLDNHLRPQHEFQLPGATTYRLEDGLNAVVADLNTTYDLGLDTTVPHSFRSTRRTGVSSTAVEVSPAAASLITDFYRNDFERFGYEPPA